MKTRAMQWVVKPFGGTSTLLIVSSYFLISVAADLASTHYFLSQLEWDCTQESNPAAEAIFCSMGFYPGAAFIWVTEPLFLFCLFFPASYSMMPAGVRKAIRSGNIAAVLCLSSYFLLIALDNWDRIDIDSSITYWLYSNTNQFKQDLIVGTALTLLAYILAMLTQLPKPYIDPVPTWRQGLHL